jgi:hypothetical protein
LQFFFLQKRGRTTTPRLVGSGERRRQGRDREVEYSKRRPQTTKKTTTTREGRIKTYPLLGESLLEEEEKVVVVAVLLDEVSMLSIMVRRETPFQTKKNRAKFFLCFARPKKEEENCELNREEGYVYAL